MCSLFPPSHPQVDPIVASFCGGGVGVLTALLIVEANNAKMQVRTPFFSCDVVWSHAAVRSGKKRGVQCGGQPRQDEGAGLLLPPIHRRHFSRGSLVTVLASAGEAAVHLLRGHWLPHMRQLRGARHDGQRGLRQLRRHRQGKSWLSRSQHKGLCLAMPWHRGEACASCAGAGKVRCRPSQPCCLCSRERQQLHSAGSFSAGSFCPQCSGSSSMAQSISAPLFSCCCAGHVHQLPVHGQEAGDGARPACGPVHTGGCSGDACLVRGCAALAVLLHPV